MATGNMLLSELFIHVSKMIFDIMRVLVSSKNKLSEPL